MQALSIPSLLLAASVAASGLAGLALPGAAQAQTWVNVQIGTPPPAPRHEVVPARRPGHVWAPGHYAWQGGGYHWVRGHWVRARPGYAYVAPAWVAQGSHWVMRPARWDARPLPLHRGPPPHARRPHADADRDGVPNRHDRRPRDPYRD